MQPALVFSFEVLVQEEYNAAHVAVGEEFFVGQATFSVARAQRKMLALLLINRRVLLADIEICEQVLVTVSGPIMRIGPQDAIGARLALR